MILTNEEGKAIVRLRVLTVRATQPFRELGVVLVRPSNWSCAKNGGTPSIEDCEEVDLSTLEY